MGVEDAAFDEMGYARPRRPIVHFGAIGEALELFQERWPLWMATTLIVMVCYSAASGLLFSIFRIRPVPGPGGFRVLLSAGGLAQAVVSTVVIGFFLGGMVRMACRQLRREPFGIETLFSVTDVAPELFLGSALYAVACVAGFSCFFVPGLVIAGLLMFTFPLIVDGRLPALEALGESWHALKGQWLTVTVFHLVAWGLTGLGSCCCVGLLITGPLYSLSIAVLYRDFFSGLPPAGLKPAPPDPEF